MTPQLPPRNPAPESSQIPSTVNKTTRTRTSDQRLVRILSGDYFGVDGRIVEVQVDVSSAGKSSFVIVGLAGKSTRESRDRIQSAGEGLAFRQQQCACGYRLGLPGVSRRCAGSRNYSGGRANSERVECIDGRSSLSVALFA